MFGCGSIYPRTTERIVWKRDKTSLRGFSLVELLIVMAVIAILAALSAPMITSLMSTGNVNQTVSGISMTLDEARAYAMAHHTYVWVGLVQPAGTTTLTVGAVAGTTGRSSDLDLTSTYEPIAKVQNYPNFSITTVAEVESSNSSMSTSSTRKWSNGTDLISGSSPLPGFTQAAAGGQVTFPAGSVVQFDPQGEANTSTTLSLPHWIQFGLQPVQGARANGPNVAVIQIAGLSGQVQVFRP